MEVGTRYKGELFRYFASLRSVRVSICVGSTGACGLMTPQEQIVTVSIYVPRGAPFFVGAEQRSRQIDCIHLIGERIVAG
jgi:hypothetical protein